MSTDATDATTETHHHDRPAAYRADHEGKKASFYRASSAGMCTRALVASMLGYSESRPVFVQNMLQTSAQEGHLHEADVKKRLEGMGVEVVEEQTVVVLPVLRDKVYVTGHVDGMVRRATHRPFPDVPMFDGTATLEVKSMSKDQFRKWMAGGFGAFPSYAWQVSIYMRTHPGRPALYAVKDRNIGTLDLRLIEEPPIPWSEIRKKILTAERWRKRGELPPCDPDAKLWGCPFIELHEEEIGEVEEGSTLYMALNDLCNEHKELSAKIKPLKELEERKKEVSKLILGMLGEGQDKIEVGGHKVTRVVQDRETADVKLMREVLGDKAEEFITPYTVTYPLVK